MRISKTELEQFTKTPFKLLDVKHFICENAIVGYDIAVFLKDEKSVDEFALWFKKEILKIKD